MKIALIGAGRMGALTARRLPADAELTVLDRDAQKAAQLAASIGADSGTAYALTSDADVLLLVLPAEAIPQAAADAAKCARPGAILVNMATNGTFPDALAAQYPELTFVNAKIIGHAGAMAQGAKGIVVVQTDDTAVLSAVSKALAGLGQVERGNASLVPLLNTLGSTEGIRAAVSLRKQLSAYGVPAAWEDAVISTVCAGTMRAYVENDLGGFGRALADKLEAED